MPPLFDLKNDTFVIKNYNEARPFSSFLPGIAGPYGKPMWVFYTNRGQGVASFGVRNKDSAMLEFNPATKAYQETPLLGFRSFFRIKHGPATTFYEPFSLKAAGNQLFRVRPHEFEIEETLSSLGLTVTIAVFNVPNESLPLLARDITIHNRGRRPLEIELVDGLPRVVPFGLRDIFNKQMTRTMEAFSQIVHVSDRLPLFKMKVEPDDKPEVSWVKGGSFAFTLWKGKSLPVLVDPERIFGYDTTFQSPVEFQAQKRFRPGPQRLEAFFGSAFSHSKFTLRPGASERLQAYYGQTEEWEKADALRRRILKAPSYIDQKREESAYEVRHLTDDMGLHAGPVELEAYSRQTYLDNTLRGGYPFVIPGRSHTDVFHFYSRKHGDMERDYNFFEIAPTCFSQGNGNFRDVNQNRRSEVYFHPGIKAGNVETFFNLLQLDGYNPLVLQAENFYVEKEEIPDFDAELRDFLAAPFRPGALYERLLELYPQREEAYDHFLRILGKARKIQEAVHGEGFWVDHWFYSLDLLDNFLAVYPDELKAVLIERRDFTYYDNFYVVQPRHKKTIRAPDGRIRQAHAVVIDPAKRKMILRRALEPNTVRAKNGEGPVYRTSLFVKLMGLLGVKLATLDPFGMGLEMEAEKPGWCDALNGLPGLFGSSMNEAFELRRGLAFVQGHLSSLLAPGETHLFPTEMVEFLKAVGEAVSLAKPDDFFKTWDTLASLRERFRERTRMGLSGDEVAWSREEAASFLAAGLRVLDSGLRKAFLPTGLCVTYFINEPVTYEALPPPVVVEPGQEPPQTVRILEFKQVPLSAFLEGPVHALRATTSAEAARALDRGVRASGLYDRKLKMFRLNVPLTEESVEIGRNKIFTPGWLENESVFLHMSYKYLLEELRSGLADAFFEDLRHQCVAFLDPAIYGRSPLENSSFIVSSRFPDARLHGGGYAARLTGATAEWISILFYMALGAQPFQWLNGELRFEPRPTLAKWMFTPKATSEFGKDTFGLKLFGKTWIVYRNPERRDTYGSTPLSPQRYRMRYLTQKEIVHEGSFLPDAYARDLRTGKMTRVLIDLA